jgi:hypothetical protein
VFEWVKIKKPRASFLFAVLFSDKFGLFLVDNFMKILLMRSNAEQD